MSRLLRLWVPQRPPRHHNLPKVTRKELQLRKFNLHQTVSWLYSSQSTTVCSPLRISLLQREQLQQLRHLPKPIRCRLFIILQIGDILFVSHFRTLGLCTESKHHEKKRHFLLYSSDSIEIVYFYLRKDLVHTELDYKQLLLMIYNYNNEDAIEAYKLLVQNKFLLLFVFSFKIDSFY